MPPAYTLLGNWANDGCVACGDYNGLRLAQSGSNPCRYEADPGPCSGSVVAQFSVDGVLLQVNRGAMTRSWFITRDGGCNAAHTFNGSGVENEDSECFDPEDPTLVPSP